MRFPAEKDLLVSMLASTILHQLLFYFWGMCPTVRLLHTVNRTNTFYTHAVSGPFSAIYSPLPPFKTSQHNLAAKADRC